MREVMTEELKRLAETAASRKPPAEPEDVTECVHNCVDRGPTMYTNSNERQNIEFSVERMPFPGIQAMDPRIVRIPPGRNNERHKHAHESIFVIMDGEGDVLIGDKHVAVKKGDVAFVPRWLVHQTTNTGDRELVVLAITDFGLTSAVLGDYDRRTRLAEGGADAFQAENGAAE